MRDLPALLSTLNPEATLVARHLWLAELLQWVRGDSQSVPAALARIRSAIWWRLRRGPLTFLWPSATSRPDAPNP
jgi:site-specific recombinase